VHTDVGDTCVGAKVNGRIMPLMTELTMATRSISSAPSVCAASGGESVVVNGKALGDPTRHQERHSWQYSGLGFAFWSAPSNGPARPSPESPAGAVLAGAQGYRGRWPPSVAVSLPDRYKKAVFPDYKDLSASRWLPWQARRAGRRSATPYAVPDPGRAARKDKSQPKDGAVPIRGVRGEPPALRAGRSGAGRPNVGIMQPNRHHRLSDPAAGAAGL
jgi:guanosine-3',5'-bis(diphosphate) 3'-pyrophosphohydrolase